MLYPKQKCIDYIEKWPYNLYIFVSTKIYRLYRKMTIYAQALLDEVIFLFLDENMLLWVSIRSTTQF